MAYSRKALSLLIYVFILIVTLFEVVKSAQIANINASNNLINSNKHEEPKTADLTMLINETLAINNKSSLNFENNQLKRADDWTFDMVEYDLMEFLQDLSARYKQTNKSPTVINNSDQLEERQEKVKEKDLQPKSTVGPNLESTSSSQSSQSSSSLKPELMTSLASGDHEIGESSWQYGIFDRFTRPRTSTTTTTPEPKVAMDSDGKFDMRRFNSDECGLRTYPTDGTIYSYPQQLEKSHDDMGEISKTLSQRRQKIPPLPPIVYNKRKQQSSDPNSEPSESFADSSLDKNLEDSNAWTSGSQNEKELNESNINKELSLSSSSVSSDLTNNGDPLGSIQPSYPSEGSAESSGGEFNLASRRYWLQQQLGNTLQLLGFNSSTQSVADFLNQTSGLSLNLRENMMKKNGNFKAAKSVEESVDDLLINTGKELKARQDELKLEPRVIGGSDAKLGDSPWSVSLQALVSRPGTAGVEYRHYCGGTIIAEHYVLTAAHCLDFMVGRESRLFVVVGDINWRMSTATLYGRRFGIEKLIIHSGYKSTAFGHDIGLIRTKEPIRPLKVNGKYIVNSVCLPEKNFEHTGEAELVGWGLFSSRNEMADSLQIADVPILPRPLCVDLYRRRTGLIQWLIGIELITDKQVCAGTFGRGICQGDSGSALVVNEKIHARSEAVEADLISGKRANVGLRSYQTRATQIGVVAFGGIRRCSYQSLPGVYMQTSKYLDWILPRIQ